MAIIKSTRYDTVLVGLKIWLCLGEYPALAFTNDTSVRQAAGGKMLPCIHFA